MIITTITGTDRPALKLLNKHVVKDASSKWHDLGLELLEQEDEEILHQIKINNNDVNECCKEMFRYWLQRCTNTTWNQLIRALRVIGLNHLATTIEEMLLSVEGTTYVAGDSAGMYTYLSRKRAIQFESILYRVAACDIISVVF